MNFHTTKRSISILLLAALLGSLAVSCGKSEANADTTVTSDSMSAALTNATHDANGYLLDKIPDELDFGGETVTILGWNHYDTVEFDVDEETGEVVNDAYYTRNRRVEERLNVKLEFLEALGRNGQTDFTDRITKSVMADAGDYDLTAGYSLNVSTAAFSGLFCNLLDVKYLDFSNPWWSRQMVDSMTIADALFFITGDICTSSFSRMQGIFFNMELLENYKLENPYELVVDGTWTLDKMFAMTAGLYKDLNGNNVKEEADQFGFTSDKVQFQPTLFTSGLRAVETNESGKLVLSPLILGERAMDVLSKIAGYVHTSPDTIIIFQTDDCTAFYDGRSLFHAFPLAMISDEQIRSAKFNYGFVPWPKYEEKDPYVVVHSNAYSLWSIPLDASNVEMSGALLEVMSSEGHRTIAPAVFETAYKVKYNTDESNLQSQIFDEMRASILVDAGRMFSRTLPFSIMDNFAMTIVDNRENWMSTIAANKEALEKRLDEIYEICKENS